MIPVLEQMALHNVRFVHLQFTDLLGLPKSVAVPAQAMPSVFASGLRFDGSAVDAFIRHREVEMYLHPDPDTFALLPWSDPHSPTARMFCSVRTAQQEYYPGCPRRQLEVVQDELTHNGLSLSASVELEFFLLNRDGKGQPSVQTEDKGGYFDLSPASPGDETRRAIVLYLQDLGVPVEASHHESSPGQHGVDIGPGDILTTADRILTAKAVIKRAATMRGLHATFMPRPSDYLGPSTLHLHLALKRSGKNSPSQIKQPRLPAELVASFAAGLLEQAAGFALVCNPLVNSYKRERLEVAQGTGGNAMLLPPNNERLVFRGADPSSNPYLVLACVAKAGLLGIQTKLTAPISASSWPADLGQALATFRSSSLCHQALGETLYSNYLAAKQVEWEVYGASVNDWETKQYLSKY